MRDLYQPARYWLATGAEGHPSSLKWIRQAVNKNRCGVKRPWLIDVYTPDLGEFKLEIPRRQDRYIAEPILQHHIWEPFETEIFQKFCNVGDFVMDIGANIGWYSLIASKMVGKEGRVWGFEPEYDNYAVAQRNAFLSENAQNVYIKQIALSDFDGKSKLFLSDENRGDHQLYDDKTGRLCLEVEVKKLDSLLLNENKLPNLVKMNAQGMEARIFDGAAELLARGWRPAWLLEFWPYGLALAGSEPLNFYKKLVELDYSIFEIDNVNLCLKKITEKYFENRILTNLAPQTMNFIDVLLINQEQRILFDKKFIQLLEPVDGLLAFVPIARGIFPRGFKAQGGQGSQCESRSGQILNDSEILFGRGGNDSFYLQKGFSYPEAGFRWTLGNIAVISFNIGEKPAENLHLLCDVFPLRGANLSAQRVKIYVNGTEQAFWKIKTPEVERLPIPASLIQNGWVSVEFHLLDAVSPKELGLNDDSRRLAVGFKKIGVEV